MTIYPAPYESPPDDDLRAAVAGWMTITVALILSWILGHTAVQILRDVATLVSGGMELEDVPAEVLVPGVGWSVAVIFLALGSIPVALRRGRGAVIFGALVSIVVTVIAHAGYAYGTLLGQWPLYWGGIAVLVLAVLPATKRWVKRLPPPTGETPIGTMPTGMTGIGSTLRPPSGTI